MILAALLFAATTTTAIPASWKSTLTEYKAALAEHNVERTFLAAAQLEQQLLPIVDHLSEGDYAQLAETTAGGMQLSRKGMIYAHPDAEFFLKMAEQFGTPADVNFFQEFQRSFPSGPMPSWIHLTSTGACVDAVGNEFPSRLRGWQVYAARFPNNYRMYVQQLLHGMEADKADVTRQCK
jgi:hypothetical protein